MSLSWGLFVASEQEGGCSVTLWEAEAEASGLHP